MNDPSSKHLLLMRHGTAKSKSGNGDFERELNENGKRDAQRMGVYMAKMGLYPDVVLSSPAIRALTTAQKCLKTAGLDADMITYDRSLYLASEDDILTMIRDCHKDTRCLMVVGHNPGLSTLLWTLATVAAQHSGFHDAPPFGDTPAFNGALAPGMMAHFEISGPWVHVASTRPETILRPVTVVDPDMLPRLYPYPDPHGTDQRPRPAYYYTQSCTVPYRKTESGLEVMIISSSSGKHWTLPKGIVDPGKTAQVSAATETLEEAGLKGQISETPLGTYAVQKWDYPCTVTVYPMEVTEQLPDTEWLENHRKRAWVSVEEAVDRLHVSDLATVVQNLPERILS